MTDRWNPGAVLQLPPITCTRRFQRAAAGNPTGTALARQRSRG